MFDISVSNRITRKPVGLDWEDLSYLDGNRPRPATEAELYKRTTVEDGLLHIAKQALGLPSYRPDMHRLARIVWDDGKWSFAFPNWSTWGKDYPGVIRINSATGSPMLTATFDKEEVKSMFSAGEGQCSTASASAPASPSVFTPASTETAATTP